MEAWSKKKNCWMLMSVLYNNAQMDQYNFEMF